MEFVIFGAGAIGCYVGGHLAATGHGVTFVARPRVAEALQEGLHVRIPRQQHAFTVHAFRTASSLAEALARPHDCVVLAIKAYDTATALAELQALGTKPPPILCLQNGVDSEDALRQVYGVEGVIAGTITTPVSKPRDNEVVVEKPRGAGVAHPHWLVEDLAIALEHSGIRARTYRAAGPMKWSKLLTNLLGNATAAALDLPVSAVFADPRLFALEVAALREALGVMRALGYPVVDLPGVPVRLLAQAVRLPAALAQPLLRRAVGGGRGNKPPSLHIDLHSGRGRTEVAWLNGAVARHAEQLGLSAPVNRALAEAVQGLATGRLNLADFRHNPAALLRLINA